MYEVIIYLNNQRFYCKLSCTHQLCINIILSPLACNMDIIAEGKIRLLDQ